VLNKQVWGWIHVAWDRGLVTGFCEYGNESLASIKYEKFLD
jgi:hypothetical protein